MTYIQNGLTRYPSQAGISNDQLSLLCNA